MAVSLDLPAVFCLSDLLEVRSAHRQNLKLAWEDAWNHGRIKLSVKCLSHRSDLQLASLLLTFIGECCLVFIQVGEALSRLVLGVHLTDVLCGHRAA